MIPQTIIHSNGSKWAGDSPAGIDELCEVLASHPLLRMFEPCIIPPKLKYDDMVRFFGNFATISHVFSISTNDPALIERLTTLICENRKRADYRSQPDPNPKKAVSR